MPPEDLSDDASDTFVTAELILFVKHLDDTVGNYRRFFNSLLVKQPDHEDLFQDLRHFREQDHIINLLTTPNDNGSDLKELYRECTKQFLASRYAHPWCRNEYGQSKPGFFDTAKSKQKQAEAKQKEDDRFHKLLVPIWIAFRRRMMPTEEELTQFLAGFEVKEAERKRALEEKRQAQKSHQPLGFAVAQGPNDGQPRSYQESIADTRPTTFNAEAFVTEDEDQVHVPQRTEGSQQAAHLFIGVAAASFLASNKRARKYVLRKIKK